MEYHKKTIRLAVPVAMTMAIMASNSQAEEKGQAANQPLNLSAERGSDIGWSKGSAEQHPVEETPSSRGVTLSVGTKKEGDDTAVAPHTKVSFGGFIKLDAQYDFDADTGERFRPEQIPLDDAEVDDHLRFQSQRARLNFKSQTRTEGYGEFRTRLEYDFNGGEGNELVTNSSVPRLRHAYGEWQYTPESSVLIGQTWSTFMPLFASFQRADHTGAVGEPFVRQSQVRFTHNSGAWRYSGAFENPETDLLANGIPCRETDPPTGTNTCGAHDKMPDIVGALEYRQGNHRAQLSSVVRELRVSEAAGAVTNDSTLAWGANIGYAYQQGPLKLATIFQGGDGLGRYSNVNPFNSGFINDSGEIETIQGFDFSPKIEYEFTPGWHAGMAYGLTRLSAESGVPDSVNEEVETIHTNIMWQPADGIKMALEYMVGERKTFGGEEADASRLQTSVWFYF